MSSLCLDDIAGTTPSHCHWHDYLVYVVTSTLHILPRCWERRAGCMDKLATPMKQWCIEVLWLTYDRGIATVVRSSGLLQSRLYEMMTSKPLHCCEYPCRQQEPWLPRKARVCRDRAVLQPTLKQVHFACTVASLNEKFRYWVHARNFNGELCRSPTVAHAGYSCQSHLWDSLL